MENVNYIVTIGDKEVEKGTVAVRYRNGEQKFDIPVDQFISELVKERDEKLIK
jgi:threonyl-tRNA synthetase